MSPFERLRHLSADLADKGNVAMKALQVSPEVGCGALRTWLEKGVIRYLEEKNQLEAMTGTSALDRSINRLLESGIITKQLHGQFHQIRIHGNDAAHGDPVELSKAHSDFRYAAAIGDWLIKYVPTQRRTSAPAPITLPAANVISGAGSDFEQFFNFRKYRALGNSKW